MTETFDRSLIPGIFTEREREREAHMGWLAEHINDGVAGSVDVVRSAAMPPEQKACTEKTDDEVQAVMTANYRRGVQ